MLTNKLSEMELSVIANALTYEITSYNEVEQTDNKRLLISKIEDTLSLSTILEPKNLFLISPYLKTILRKYVIYLLKNIESANSENQRENIRTLLYCCSYLISEM